MMKGALPLHRKGEDMNIHKEKCKRLKAIRKKLADGLGIDLKQRECTFEGECRGTCPKCRQEEEALNRALLGKAAAVAVSAGILLTGCQGETENTGNPSGRSNIDWEETQLDGNIVMPPPEEFDLEGETELTGVPVDYEIVGEEILAPEDESAQIYELAGDIEPEYDESVSTYGNEE